MMNLDSITGTVHSSFRNVLPSSFQACLETCIDKHWPHQKSDCDLNIIPAQTLAFLENLRYLILYFKHIYENPPFYEAIYIAIRTPAKKMAK